MITVKIKVKNMSRCKHYLKIIENMQENMPEAQFLIILNDNAISDNAISAVNECARKEKLLRMENENG